MLKLVSCDHVTSFNYDDKKARDVGLTCWRYLSNNMHDNIFHESMRQGVTCSVSLFFCFFLCGVILLFSSGWKRWNQFYHYNISGRGEILSYNELKQMGLITLQWDLKSRNMSGDLRHRIALWGSFVFIWCVAFKQGCCVFIQHSVLRVVANAF